MQYVLCAYDQFFLVQIYMDVSFASCFFFFFLSFFLLIGMCSARISDLVWHGVAS